MWAPAEQTRVHTRQHTHGRFATLPQGREPRFSPRRSCSRGAARREPPICNNAIFATKPSSSNLAYLGVGPCAWQRRGGDVPAPARRGREDREGAVRAARVAGAHHAERGGHAAAPGAARALDPRRPGHVLPLQGRMPNSHSHLNSPFSFFSLNHNQTPCNHRMLD